MTEHFEVTEWWCPGDERWVWCPGPCPDGTDHTPTRTRTLAAARAEARTDTTGEPQ